MKINLTFIIGILFGIFMIVYGISIGDSLIDLAFDQLWNFVDPASVMIVLGGTLATMIAGNPPRALLRFPKHLGIILNQKRFDPQGIIDEVVELAQIARKNGLLALEERANQMEDNPFFKKSIMLIVDGNDADKVRAMLESDIDQLSTRHDDVATMYERAASAAPAFGMIGTLIGLINMLTNMNVESGGNSIGKDMGVALITTFYGCILAHLIFNPIANSLRTRDEEECLCMQIIVDGIMAIQSGENPKFIREKLEGYLEQSVLEGGGEKRERRGKRGRSSKEEE